MIIDIYLFILSLWEKNNQIIVTRFVFNFILLINYLIVLKTR